MSSDRQTSFAAIFLLFLLSGATSLIYEVVWLRQLVLIFGSTQFATSTVLSTFMGGLALGAFLAGRWLNRTRTRPLRIYGMLEIGIGVYAVAVPILFGSLTPIYRAVWAAGASESFLVLSLAKFAGIAAVLLPPTTLMGASLPVLAREVADDPDRIGGKVGVLYAINTFGAVLGVFVAGFVAIPGIGVQRTLWSTAGVNLMLGLTAILLARSLRAPTPLSAGSDNADHPSPATPGRIRLVLLVFGLSGFGALVLEVAWTRVLALVMGSSVYAFSLMLLAFLIGLALGSSWCAGYLRRRPSIDPARLLAFLLFAAGALAYATAFVFQHLPRLFAEIYFRFEPGPNGWFAVQLLFGLIVMFPATFAFGGIFPAVLQIHARGLDTVARSVGVVYASNTVGTIVGAAAAGFFMIPRLGVLNTVVVIALIEIALALLIAIWVVPESARARSRLVVPMVVALVAVVLVRPAWNVNTMNSGVYMNVFSLEEGKGWDEFYEMTRPENNVVRFAAEGYTASVFVADQPQFDNRYLSVNGKIEASTSADLETQLMCAHIPLLLHDDPKDVLVIGLASAITVGAVAAHPVESIRVVEVEKEMIPAARLFAEENNHVLDDRRVVLSINDARNELEFSSDTYDVIISEPSNPWMTVASNLFTEDFFRMARTRVRPGGVFSQWIQNYYLPAEDLRSIIAAFRESFEHVLLFETFEGIDLLLMGSEQPLTMDFDELERRMSELNVRMDMARVESVRPVDILSLYRLGPRQVDRLVEGAPRNTDDNARVEFSAPKTLGLYTLGENLRMLRGFMGDPLEALSFPIEDAAERDRLRLALAQRWVYIGEYELAAGIATDITDETFRPMADRLVEFIQSRDSQ